MLIVIRVFYAIALVLYTATAIGYLRAFNQKMTQPRKRRMVSANYAVLFQLLGLATYTMYLQQAPFLGMFQGFTFAAFVLAFLFLFISRNLENDVAVGVIVFPLVCIFSLIGIFTPLELVNDPLLAPSPWFILHASIALFSYGAFAIAFATSVLYLQLHGEIKSKRLGTFFARLPSLGELDHLTYLTISIGFVALSVAIATGMAWTQIRLGKLLQLDTKEIFTFVNWVIFALYLHSRLYRGWRGRRAAWMAIAGFLVLLFNFLIVTVLLSKTHSYL